MVRELDLSLIFMAGLVAAGVAFSRRHGDGSPGSPFQSRSKMPATEPQTPRPVRACLGTEATIARWGEPGLANWSSHTVSTKQTAGARLGLIPLGGSTSAWGSEDDDPPVSVRTSEGPMCSVNTPRGLACTTAPMGCAYTPIGDRARDRFPFVP